MLASTGTTPAGVFALRRLYLDGRDAPHSCSLAATGGALLRRAAGAVFGRLALLELVRAVTVVGVARLLLEPAAIAATGAGVQSMGGLCAAPAAVRAVDGRGTLIGASLRTALRPFFGTGRRTSDVLG